MGRGREGWRYRSNVRVGRELEVVALRGTILRRRNGVVGDDAEVGEDVLGVIQREDATDTHYQLYPKLFFVRKELPETLEQFTVLDRAVPTMPSAMAPTSTLTLRLALLALCWLMLVRPGRGVAAVPMQRRREWLVPSDTTA